MREMVETSCAMFEMARQSGRDLPDAFTPLEILGHRGGVFGLCNLVDVITGPLEFSTHIASGKFPKHQAAWYMGGFALILEDVRGVPFVSCGGAPGLFGIHPAAYEQLHLSA
jgi:hypothetical protein